MNTLEIPVFFLCKEYEIVEYLDSKLNKTIDISKIDDFKIVYGIAILKEYLILESNRVVLKLEIPYPTNNISGIFHYVNEKIKLTLYKIQK